ncbi:hypothetical protein TESG_05774 [Trichophyton tonsurans CBS 112818]|uniref:Uncharacterized protein n=1 Tax=Trichophyton tonsurans (strain CBS 112818) TaxID=647933 RepID=F2S496_TRIT1|nr:hypothetical protein TESG_05774 [Trichophyton tonsurans CBS 112818]
MRGGGRRRRRRITETTQGWSSAGGGLCLASDSTATLALAVDYLSTSPAALQRPPGSGWAQGGGGPGSFSLAVGVCACGRLAWYGVTMSTEEIPPCDPSETAQSSLGHAVCLSVRPAGWLRAGGVLDIRRRNNGWWQKPAARPTANRRITNANFAAGLPRRINTSNGTTGSAASCVEASSVSLGLQPQPLDY